MAYYLVDTRDKVVQRVTDSAPETRPHFIKVWAESVAEAGLKAEERLVGERAHFDKYERLAQALGVDALRRSVPFTIEQITDALSRDPNMNNLRLQVWDSCDWMVRQLVRKAGGSQAIGEPGGWSLGNTVCVLKHVARHHVAGWRRP